MPVPGRATLPPAVDASGGGTVADCVDTTRGRGHRSTRQHPIPVALAWAYSIGPGRSGSNQPFSA